MITSNTRLSDSDTLPGGPPPHPKPVLVPWLQQQQLVLCEFSRKVRPRCKWGHNRASIGECTNSSSPDLCSGVPRQEPSPSANRILLGKSNFYLPTESLLLITNWCSQSIASNFNQAGSHQSFCLFLIGIILIPKLPALFSACITPSHCWITNIHHSRITRISSHPNLHSNLLIILTCLQFHVHTSG